ncbi:hypothetical protein TNCV_1676141 [Trichonephila clavipes]|nr:hypothetical protein TNCV_1676141 [Trichonephila clavipes]
MITESSSGRSILVVKVTDSWREYHEFEPSTVKDTPYREPMHVKYVQGSNVLPWMWCVRYERGHERGRPQDMNL